MGRSCRQETYGGAGGLRAACGPGRGPRPCALPPLPSARFMPASAAQRGSAGPLPATAGSASGGSRRPALRRLSRTRTSPRRCSAHAPRRRAPSASSSRGRQGQPPTASADLARPPALQSPRLAGAAAARSPQPLTSQPQASAPDSTDPRLGSGRPRLPISAGLPPAPPPPCFRRERAQRPRRRPAPILE